MDALFAEFAKYGLAGLLMGIILYYCYNRMNKQDERIDKDNEWKMQVIQNDTQATLGATAAQIASTDAIKALVLTAQANNDILKDIQKKFNP